MMNTEKEIEKITERQDQTEDRLSYIESFLRKTFPPNPAASMVTNGGGTQPDYEVSGLKIRKTENEHGWHEYAYKLTIANTSDQMLSFNGRIVFLDSDEYEVDQALLPHFTIDAKSESTRSGKHSILDKTHASRVANVTAEISLI